LCNKTVVANTNLYSLKDEKSVAIAVVIVIIAVVMWFRNIPF